MVDGVVARRFGVTVVRQAHSSVLPADGATTDSNRAPCISCGLASVMVNTGMSGNLRIE